MSTWSVLINKNKSASYNRYNIVCFDPIVLVIGLTNTKKETLYQLEQVRSVFLYYISYAIVLTLPITPGFTDRIRLSSLHLNFIAT